LTQLTFSIGDQPVARIVRVKVHLTYGGREALAETWFYTWW
jgi:glucan biosynthesis protein